MNQKFWSGITTAALTTVLGTTVSLVSSSSRTIASPPEANPVSIQTHSTETSETSETSNVSNPPLSETTETINQVQDSAPSRIAPRENSIVTIYPHRWKGLLAVTLRVRDIPVVTFLGSPKSLGTDSNYQKIIEEKENETGKIYPSQDDPIGRAKIVADRLNQLLQDDTFEAEQIAVNWNGKNRTYSITAKDEVLVTIDENTILPDTTKNRTKDALQMTNRLRRLLGDAEPISEIDGKPIEKPGAGESPKVRSQAKGVASWYGPGFHGRRTSNGERYNQYSLTAAHRSLPFGTRVRVTNLRNGKSVIVRINDRGPFSHGRIIDLSAGAAQAVGLKSSGVGKVQLEVLDL